VFFPYQKIIIDKTFATTSETHIFGCYLKLLLNPQKITKMALELFAENQCGVDGDVIAQRIRDFTALMPKRSAHPAEFVTIQHSKDIGLINFDFSKEIITRLLEDGVKGLRIIPALDKKGSLTVVITPYIEGGDEMFTEGKLVAECCPQPPPPFNKESRLYHEIYDGDDEATQQPLIA